MAAISLFWNTNVAAAGQVETLLQLVNTGNQLRAKLIFGVSIERVRNENLRVRCHTLQT